ncbi:IS30 family transposase [Gordonia sp. KTR9]|nr:IS30 family transposase [Gordonia sp. KTR9]
MKNGPALGGYGAVAMNARLTASMASLPQQLRKTLTWDRGKKLSTHAQFAMDTGTHGHRQSYTRAKSHSPAIFCLPSARIQTARIRRRFNLY